MLTTGNLNLKKPEGTDIVDINDLNGNMDILDTAVKAVQDHTTDTTKHITALERNTWNAKASILDLGTLSPWATGNGWRTIATSSAGVTKRQATVIVEWSNGTASGQAIFVVSINDNASPEITQIAASSSATNQGLVQARVVYHSTTKGNTASIDVFKAGAALSSFNVKLVASEGWTPVISSTAAVVPTDYSSLALTFTNGGIATTGQITTTYADGAPFKVSNSTVVTGLNVEKLGGADLPTVVQGTMSYAGLTSGTSTAYTATLNPSPPGAPSAGLRLSFKAHVASFAGPAPTLNINGLGAKSIYKADGNPAKLALNGVYTVVYDGTNFILQGEGGGVDLNGTNAVPEHVLAGETFLSSNGEGVQTGTLTDLRGDTLYAIPLQTYTGRIDLIPWNFSTGFIDQDTVIMVDDGSITSANIMAGRNVLGMTGSGTNDATATAADIVVGKSAYVNGVKINGSKSPVNNTLTTSTPVTPVIISSSRIQYTFHVTLPTGKSLQHLNIKPILDVSNGFTWSLTGNAMPIMFGSWYNQMSTYGNSVYALGSSQVQCSVTLYSFDSNNGDASIGYELSTTDGSLIKAGTGAVNFLVKYVLF